MNPFVQTICVNLLLFTSFQGVKNVEGAQPYVQIYSRQSFQGHTEQVNLIRSCNSVSHFLRAHGQIESMNTKDNCVNVYETEDCSGRFISLKPRNPFHYALGKWDNIHRRIKSIGRCHDDCHGSKISRNHKTARVVAFRSSDFQGETHTVTIKQRTCTPLPKKMQGVVMSFKVHPKVCIELHEFANCRGDFRDFPVGSPGHNNLRHWGEWNKEVRVESVSFCGYRCHSEAKKTTLSSPRTIFTTIKPRVFAEVSSRLTKPIQVTADRQSELKSRRLDSKKQNLTTTTGRPIEPLEVVKNKLKRVYSIKIPVRLSLNPAGIKFDQDLKSPIESKEALTQQVVNGKNIASNINNQTSQNRGPHSETLELSLSLNLQV